MKPPKIEPFKCKDCSLKNKNKKDGHCYMWENWPDENICSEFRRKDKIECN